MTKGDNAVLRPNAVGLKSARHAVVVSGYDMPVAAAAAVGIEARPGCAPTAWPDNLVLSALADNAVLIGSGDVRVVRKTGAVDEAELVVRLVASLVSVLGQDFDS